MSRPYGEEEAYIEALLEKVSLPIVRVGTKKDLSRKNLTSLFDIEISSVKDPDFSSLLEKISVLLPETLTLFADDVYTKQDVYFRISEIIREKAFEYTKEEIPHSIFVQVEEIEDTPELLRISAYIYAESESQKTILI